MESSVRWSCGWLHGDLDHVQRPRLRHVAESPGFEKWERLVESCAARLEGRPEIRRELSLELGVTPAALAALDVGLSGSSSTWPMRDYLGRAVGVRLRRLKDGSKLAVRGSQNALFIPRKLAEQSLVLVTEGATDTAAALELGFYAIGRPDCAGGTRHLARWLARRSDRDLVLVADDDAPGRRGALELAAVLAALAQSVRVIIAPGGAKDLRRALRSGVTRDAVLEAIAAAPRVSVAVARRSR